MKRILKGLLAVLIVLFILVQFYPKPEKNQSSVLTNDISTVHSIPLQVQQTLKTACYDCHSNHTQYPWYASIQPVALWLKDHIEEGKKELNFSEFANYSLARRYRKLEEINSQVQENEMPLSSYTIIHRDAKLSAEQKKSLAMWTESVRDSMQKSYPADSLIRKKK